MSTALKLALAPLLLAQALRTRRRALRLPEAQVTRDGVVGEPAGAPALTLLILGDSSAAGVGVAMQHQALAGHLAPKLAALSGRVVHWRLVARSGLNSLQAQALWRQHGAPAAALAVVVTGVNDVVDQVSPLRAQRARAELAAALERESGTRHIVFTALPPMGAFTALPQPLRWMAGRDAGAHDRALARWLQGQAARSHLAVDLPLDPALLACDGFHPGAEVYRIWGEALARALAARA